MSIVIKGVEMPKESWECPCHNGETGRCKVTGRSCCDIPKDCPLVEIQTPSRMSDDTISRQAAIDYCYQLINVEHQQGSDDMNYGAERVNQTETILHHFEFMASAEPERRGKWIIRTRHEHFPSGKEYTELVCPFCGRTDHNGDGCYCGYCGCKMEVDE